MTPWPTSEEDLAALLAENRERLGRVASSGGITLVLGAGATIDQGLPAWGTLAQKMWAHAFSDTRRTSPWELPPEQSPTTFPQFLPIVFELVRNQLGEEKFRSTLKELLYEGRERGQEVDPDTTVGALALLIAEDYQLSDPRRIIRIVTLSMDDLLRDALRHQCRERNLPQIYMTMGHVITDLPHDRPERPVPIYPVHGFLPLKGPARLSEHRLVYTDSQYWESASSNASFANRIMSSALADSHCVFIGLSMTDINVLRWLADRFNELADDEDSQSGKSQLVKPGEGRPRGIDKHFWIRAKGDDPSGILTEFLFRRGVDAVEIDDWESGAFQALIRDCFSL
jgi:hypothetical protein